MPITDANVPQMLPQGSVTEGLSFVGSTNHPDPRMVCRELFILRPPPQAVPRLMTWKSTSSCRQFAESRGSPDPGIFPAEELLTDPACSDDICIISQNCVIKSRVNRWAHLFGPNRCKTWILCVLTIMDIYIYQEIFFH